MASDKQRPETVVLREHGTGKAGNENSISVTINYQKQGPVRIVNRDALHEAMATAMENRS